MFELFEFLEVDGILVLLLVLLLPREEVSDELVESLVLAVLDPLALDLLLVIHQLVVSVRLVDALVQFHLPQAIGTVKHTLVFFELSLQFFFFKVFIVGFIKDARVVRGGRATTSTHICCLSSRLY